MARMLFDIHARTQEINRLISEAEQCAGECKAGTPELAAMEKLIEGLRAMIRLLEALTDFLYPRKG